MSDLFSISIHPAASIEPLVFVRAAHHALLRGGAGQDGLCEVRLAPHGDLEPEAERIREPREALLELAEWPTLGSVEYAFGDYAL